MFALNLVFFFIFYCLLHDEWGRGKRRLMHNNKITNALSKIGIQKVDAGSLLCYFMHLLNDIANKSSKQDMRKTTI